MNNLVIENVRGSVANVKGDLLLGQSFLSRFKSWSIDNARQALVLAQWDEARRIAANIAKLPV
jgi:predicted aspartyl protease